jgi:hypothetical protein
VSLTGSSLKMPRTGLRAAYAELEQAGELPEQITARATAIARVARVSQQTLYKHLSPVASPIRQGVINEASGLSAAQSEPSMKLQPRISESTGNESITPFKEKMKGEALCADAGGSD